ncbi:hypothetical protein FF1_035889 [Malus domestica]
MSKSTHSTTLDLDAIAAAADVRQEHLRMQVDDLGESISALETQQTHLQQSIDTLNTSNTTFQNNMTSQFAAFQSLLLDELRLLKINAPPSQTSTHTVTHHTTTPASTPLTSHRIPLLPSVPALLTQLHLLHFDHFSCPPMLNPYQVSGFLIFHKPSPLPSYSTTRPHPVTTTTSSRPNPTHPSQASSSLFSPNIPSSFSTHPQSCHLIPFTTPNPSPIFINPSLENPHSHFKALKLELPQFNGEDPYGWLAMAERYLDYYEMPPHQWVLVAACNFGADASIWICGFEQRYG